MASEKRAPQNFPSPPISSTSTLAIPSKRTSTSNSAEKLYQCAATFDLEPGHQPYQNEDAIKDKTSFEKYFDKTANAKYNSMGPVNRKSLATLIHALFSKGGALEPFRLLQQDVRNIRERYISDWTLFNQLVFASAVYIFFTNILPGITFASDLHVLTGETWGTIEVVFSTGLCGIIFALSVFLLHKVYFPRLD